MKIYYPKEYSDLLPANKVFLLIQSSELTSIIVRLFEKKMNLARIKFIGQMIIALCKVQTVNYQKLSAAFETPVESASNLRRIQRFFSSYELNMDLTVRFICRLLPVKGKYGLVQDRICWDFGCIEINLLVLSILHNGHAFPVLFSDCKAGQTHQNFVKKSNQYKSSISILVIFDTLLLSARMKK
jgi:hypothetical protein